MNLNLMVDFLYRAIGIYQGNAIRRLSFQHLFQFFLGDAFDAELLRFIAFATGARASDQKAGGLADSAAALSSLVFN